MKVAAIKTVGKCSPNSVRIEKIDSFGTPIVSYPISIYDYRELFNTGITHWTWGYTIGAPRLLAKAIAFELFGDKATSNQEEFLIGKIGRLKQNEDFEMELELADIK